MQSSKLTSKLQATIPSKERQILKVKAGDRISFEIGENDIIVIRKTSPIDLAYAHALEKTLTDEWTSVADKEAYCDL